MNKILTIFSIFSILLLIGGCNEKKVQNVDIAQKWAEENVLDTLLIIPHVGYVHVFGQAADAAHFNVVLDKIESTDFDPYTAETQVYMIHGMFRKSNLIFYEVSFWDYDMKFNDMSPF